MPATDRNETVENLTVTESLTDPGDTTHTDSIGGSSAGLNLENTDDTTFLTTDTLHAETALAWSDDGDGTATLAVQPDSVTESLLAFDPVTQSELTTHADADDAHHAKTQPSDIDSSNWGDYEIQKDGTDGPGVINFKTS